MIPAAEFLAIPEFAAKIASERRCAVLVHSVLQQLGLPDPKGIRSQYPLTNKLQRKLVGSDISSRGYSIMSWSISTVSLGVCMCMCVCVCVRSVFVGTLRALLSCLLCYLQCTSYKAKVSWTKRLSSWLRGLESRVGLWGLLHWSGDDPRDLTNEQLQVLTGKSGKSKWGLSNGGLRPLPGICAQSSTIVHMCGLLGPFVKESFCWEDGYPSQHFLDTSLPVMVVEALASCKPLAVPPCATCCYASRWPVRPNYQSRPAPAKNTSSEKRMF